MVIHTGNSIHGFDMLDGSDRIYMLYMQVTILMILVVFGICFVIHVLTVNNFHSYDICSKLLNLQTTNIVTHTGNNTHGCCCCADF